MPSPRLLVLVYPPMTQSSKSIAGPFSSSTISLRLQVTKTNS